MKKRVRVPIIIGLLVLCLTITAQGATSWSVQLQQVFYSSGFQVQNLSSTDTRITIFYYPRTGNPVGVSDTIPGGNSVTYATIHSEAGESFIGSVVVRADQPVVSIVNTLGDFPQYAAATNSFSTGSQSFALPLVMCNNTGFDTWFNVQNIGSDNANVTIEYIPGFAGVGDSETTTIESNRAERFDQASGSSTVNCDSLAGADGRFVGSARITSDQLVVATVMQVNTSSYLVMMGYNGFTGGSANIKAPLIMSNNNGFYTGLQVQNMSATPTTVTVAYADNTVISGTVSLPKPDDDVFELGSGEAKTLIHNDAPPANGSEVNDYDAIGHYIGGASVTASGDVTLVAIVNQFSPNPGGDPRGTAHEGFNPGQATNRLAAPLIMSNNNTYYTGIQVQNVGMDEVEVTISYGPNSAGSGAPQNEVFTLQPNDSKTIIQNAAPPSNGSTVNDWGVIGQYVGSATVIADNGTIAAIVNEFTGEFPGDQFYTYNAFNY